MTLAAAELESAAMVLQWLFLAYFVAASGGGLLLQICSIPGLKRAMLLRAISELPQAASRHELPVSIIVVAKSARASIVPFIHSLLRLDYRELEVIVVIDGPHHAMLATLKSEFRMQKIPEAYWRRLDVRPVNGIYRSVPHPNLRLVDKAEGGRADALNAGINAARYPLFCTIETGAILGRGSLRRLVQPFLDDPSTCASGCAARPANGCSVSEGFVSQIRLPRSAVGVIQTVELMRTRLYTYMGWASMNALLLFPGTFAAFRKEDVVAVGGYRRDAVSEDAELVVRLHRFKQMERQPYRIALVPDAICWSDVPERVRLVAKQRAREQHGLAEALTMNRSLAFGVRGGAPGWLAVPLVTLFEILGPMIELLAYTLVLAGYVLGLLSPGSFLAFWLVVIALGLLLSFSALLFEECSDPVYREPGQLAALMLAALAENLGYRQLLTLSRVAGLWHWLRKSAGSGDRK